MLLFQIKIFVFFNYFAASAPRYLVNEETHKLMKFSDISCILLTSSGLRNRMIENTEYGKVR